MVLLLPSSLFLKVSAISPSDPPTTPQREPPAPPRGQLNDWFLERRVGDAEVLRCRKGWPLSQRQGCLSQSDEDQVAYLGHSCRPWTPGPSWQPPSFPRVPLLQSRSTGTQRSWWHCPPLLTEGPPGLSWLLFESNGVGKKHIKMRFGLNGHQKPGHLHILKFPAMLKIIKKC